MSEASDIAPFPVPDDGPLWAPFWQGTRQGLLLFMACRQCGHFFLPARDQCPRCLMSDLIWERASGQAHLISWVVYHRSPNAAFDRRIPYTVAIVELDEGLRMVTNIVGVENPETLRIGQRLTLRIEDEGGPAVPRFVPA